VEIRMAGGGFDKRPGKWAKHYFGRRMRNPVEGAEQINQHAVVACGARLGGNG
jgi:hypothetical protein